MPERQCARCGEHLSNTQMHFCERGLADRLADLQELGYPDGSK